MKLEAILQKLGLLQTGKIMYIGGSDVLPAPLKPEQERQAVAALEQGDEAAKQLLIEHNLRLVVYIARRFENTGVNLEDLISIGTIGLIRPSIPSGPTGTSSLRRIRRAALKTRF